MSLLVIVPTYNERDNLKILADKILSQKGDIRILIVDDNSPDGTGEIAKQMAASDKRVKVLHNIKKMGLGSAYLEGFKYAIKNMPADYFMQMDADLSHDPSAIPEFLKAMKDNDVVIGSRYLNGKINIVNWPLRRLILSYGASVYVRLFSRVALSDPTSGYKCFRKSAVEYILSNKISSGGYAFQIEINYIMRKAGFKMAEIPIIFHDRDKGASKMSQFKTIFEAFFIVWALKFRRFAPRG